MRKVLFFACSLLLVACSPQNDSTEPPVDEVPVLDFSLNGKTRGVDHGMVLYLRDLQRDEIIDSTTIDSNQFHFEGDLRFSPLEVAIHTGDFRGFRRLWLEANDMTFDASNSKWRDAPVTGSPTELVNMEYMNIDSIRNDSARALASWKFIAENPKSIVSASALAVYATTWGKDKADELYNLLSVQNKNSSYGKKVAHFIELNQNPGINDPFVDFEMKDSQGMPERLSDLKGKVILLEFWASWCRPCRRENPNLLQTFKDFHPKGFEIFAVGVENDKRKWIEAIEKDGLPWHHVSELNGPENSANLIYGISKIPDNFLIDRNGIIVARDLRGEELRAKLAELLGER